MLDSRAGGHSLEGQPGYTETSLSVDRTLGPQFASDPDVSNLASRLIKLLRKVGLVNELMQDGILHTEQTSPGSSELCGIVTP